MKKLTLLLMLLFCAGGSQAQTQPDTLSNKAFGFYFYAPIELPIIDNAVFREGLRNADLPDPRHPYTSIVLGIQWYINRSIASMSFGMGGRKEEEAAYFSKMDYSSFSFSYGYDLVKYPYFAAYPYIGLKANSLATSTAKSPERILAYTTI